MPLTLEDVETIARLARLQLSEQEKAEFVRQLGQILAHFQHLQQLSTESVAPTSHPLPLTNVFRDDDVAPSLPRDEVLSNAPEHDDRYFIVPRIVE